MQNKLLGATLIISMILSITTIASATDDIYTYLDSLVGNINSNEILNVKSTYDLDKTAGVFDETSSCSEKDNSYAYDCYIYNHELGVSLNAKFTYDDYKRQAVIVQADIQFKFSGDEVIAFNEIERIKSKLLLSGINVTDTTVRYAKFEYASIPNKSYIFRDDNNYVSGEMRVPSCIDDSCEPNSLSIVFKYGKPNAVKSMETKSELNDNDISALITKSSIYSVTNKYPSNINVHIMKNGVTTYNDAVKLDDDCNIYVKNESPNNAILDKHNKIIAIPYICGTGNRANDMSLLLYKYTNDGIVTNKIKLTSLGMKYTKIDTSDKYYIISENLTGSSIGSAADLISVPTIYELNGNTITNVTGTNAKFLNESADRSLRDYAVNKGGIGNIHHYLLLKTMTGASKDAWKKYDSLYSGKEKQKTKKVLKKSIDEYISYVNKNKNNHYTCINSYCEYEL